MLSPFRNMQNKWFPGSNPPTSCQTHIGLSDCHWHPAPWSIFKNVSQKMWLFWFINQSSKKENDRRNSGGTLSQNEMKKKKEESNSNSNRNKSCNQLPKLSCQKLLSVAKSFQKSPSVSNSYHQLTKVAISCQKLPSVDKTCHQLPKAAKSRL